MVKSMTAFARRESQGEWGALTCELRGVNHRYLDLTLRLPEDLRPLEGALRERLQTRLGRGKLDCGFRYQPSVGGGPALTIDHDLVQRLLETCEQIEGVMGAAEQFSALEVLRWPGVVREPTRDLGAMHAAALNLAEESIEDFIVVRRSEGRRLATLLRQRSETMRLLVSQIRGRRTLLIEALHDKYRVRLAELGVDADPGRLEQELALVAQRLDVDEELDRLDSHLTELDAALARDEPVGRRLDFLMQEFNREANTLGSKSSDIETTQATVELKVLIEQMREQIQNIE